MKKLLLALFSVIVFSSTCLGANEVYFGVKFKADKSEGINTFKEKYHFDGSCHLTAREGEYTFSIGCSNAKQKEEALTTLKALSEEIEKAGYGDCMFTKKELRDDLTMHGKYVNSEVVKVDDFSNVTFVTLTFKPEKISMIEMWNAYTYNN